MFKDRAKEMGLKELIKKAVFSYEDKYSQVVYKTLETSFDREEVPHLAVYTKLASSEKPPKFAGLVSDKYEFTGNEAIVNKIKNCINETGEPLFNEKTTLSPNLMQMRTELVIQHKNQNPKVGDIYPQVIVTNSYNGSGAINISFGMAIANSVGSTSGKIYSFGFKTKLESVRQVHLKSSSSIVTTSIGNYVEKFNKNINTIIEENFKRTFTEDDVFKTLELIEKLGKKRRNEISKHLNDMSQNGKKSMWDLFHLLIKFSSEEKNINVKVALEDVAERTLVLPQKMLSFVDGV